MAQLVDINYTGKFNLPIPIGRLNPVPADSTEVWDTYANASNYAKTGATAYVGQILYVKADAKHYYISNEAGDLVEIGSSAVAGIASLTNEEIDKIIADAKVAVNFDSTEAEVGETP